MIVKGVWKFCSFLLVPQWGNIGFFDEQSGKAERMIND